MNAATFLSGGRELDSLNLSHYMAIGFGAKGLCLFIYYMFTIMLPNMI